MGRFMKLLILGTFFFSITAFADTWVNGYQKRDGSYVQGHYKSRSNNTRNDNYSTRGNRNPYTGSYGTKPRDNNYGFGSGTTRRRSKSGW